MSEPSPAFTAPTSMERLFNRVFGFLVGIGIGLGHNYVLQVRGRKSGRVYETPVDVLSHDGKRYLVAPRGAAQWVRNAAASGEVVLRRGRRRETYGLRPLADAEKPPVLCAYLSAFRLTVQRYFPVPAGSPVDAFVPLAARYPAFELLPKG